MYPPVEQLLKESGLSVTIPRLALLEAVSKKPHATAEEIVTQVRSSIGSVSRQAIFDSLAAMSEKGIVRRIQPARSPARYETRVGDNHHHLICRGCGQVADVDCAVGEVPCLQASDDHGFEIDEAEVIYWGYCKACDAAAEKVPEIVPQSQDQKTKDLKNQTIGEK